MVLHCWRHPHNEMALVPGPLTNRKRWECTYESCDYGICEENIETHRLRMKHAWNLYQ